MVSNLGRKIEEGFKRSKEEGIEKGIEKGIEEGIKKGIEKKAKEIAVTMLKMGMSTEIVCQAKGLDESTVEELKNSITN